MPTSGSKHGAGGHTGEHGLSAHLERGPRNELVGQLAPGFWALAPQPSSSSASGWYSIKFEKMVAWISCSHRELQAQSG